MIAFIPCMSVSAKKLENKNTAFFYSNEIGEEEKGFLNSRITDIVNNIVFLDPSMEKSVFEMGTPIEVVNDKGCYYIPLYIDNKCRYLIVLCRTEDGRCYISYCESKSDIFNSLLPGKYYLMLYDNEVFLVGDNGITDRLSDKIDEECYPVFSQRDVTGYFLHEITKELIKTDFQSRGILSKTISVPYYANGGQYGYCWLCSALCITKTLDPTFTTGLVNAHSYIHGLSHTLYDCPSGTRTDAYNVISFYTNMTGNDVTYNLDAAHAMASINSDIPIYMSLRRPLPDGTTAGHASVICGYIFNNTDGQFTYVICDPNYSSYKYQITNYSDNPVYYSPSSTRTYEWTGAIYGWH